MDHMRNSFIFDKWTALISDVTHQLARLREHAVLAISGDENDVKVAHLLAAGADMLQQLQLGRSDSVITSTLQTDARDLRLKRILGAQLARGVSDQSNQKGVCDICFTRMKKILIGCGHLICNSCFTQLIGASSSSSSSSLSLVSTGRILCPICRTVIDKVTVVSIDPKNPSLVCTECKQNTIHHCLVPCGCVELCPICAVDAIRANKTCKCGSTTTGIVEFYR